MEPGQTYTKCTHAIPGNAPLALCPQCLLELATLSPADFSETLSPAVSFDDYEELEVLGRGAMAVVYKARQRSLGRTVALKMLRSYDTGDSVLATRLRIEAEATANLHHPNIVTLYSVGEHQGAPFIAMEYVDGLPMNRFITGEGFRCESVSPVPGEKRRGAQATIARVLAKLARAIEHSHRQGILHRDIKPSNVLIDPRGEPRLTDFGLAKILSGHLVSNSNPGAFQGSPPYMSPEQASGKPVSTASDIYSLGATLYEMLTGQPPFKGSTVAETVHKLLHEPPPHPLLLNKSLDPDLSTVCLKCLNKEPSARYESAQSLAEELERWLRGEPIEARPTRFFERAWRWAWREPKLAALSIGLLLLLGTVTVLSLTLYEREKARLDKADREKVYLIANLKPRLKREWDKEGLVQLNAKELASFMKQEFPEEYHELVVGITAPSSDADPINLVPKHVPFLNVVQAARPQSSAQLVFGLYLYKTQAAAIAGINEHSLDIIRLAADDYAILSEQDMSLELTPLVLEDPTNAGVIFVRADSGISEARDLKGKTLLLGNPESCLGHLWPKAALAENGLRWSDFKCITNALSGNVISMVHRSRTFPADDFKEVSAFAEKLCSPADSLSADIASQLDKEAREELDLYRSKRKASLKMAPLLAANLNRIVNGPSIWDPALFAGVKLRPETLELCDRNPSGTDACRLNRLLLEDAYPRELARREEYDAGVAESAELKEFGAQFKIITEFNYPGYVWLATDRLKSNPTLFEAVRQRLLHAKSSGDFREFAPAELNGLRERLRHARSFDFAISVKSGAEAN